MHFDYLNTQGQPKFVWPPSFALARAYVDQLERSNGMPRARITAVREGLDKAEKATGQARATALHSLGTSIQRMPTGAEASRVQKLADAVHALAAAK